MIISTITRNIERLKTILRALKKNFVAAPKIFVSLIIVSAVASLLGYLPALISRAVLNASSGRIL